MDHALPMRVSEGVGHFDRVAHDVTNGQRPADQTLRQGLAVERLHHEERKAIVLADVVQGTNVRMAQARERSRLAFEALAAGRAVGHVPRQDLDRHHSAEPRIDRAVDLAHAAAAEQRVNLIGAEASAFR